jgi:hypothetical protein
MLDEQLGKQAGSSKGKKKEKYVLFDYISDCNGVNGTGTPATESLKRRKTRNCLRTRMRMSHSYSKRALPVSSNR